MTKVLDSFCRTCMVKVVGQTNKIIANFHIFQTEGFAHKFTQCTNLQVHPDDEYPSSVCENCLASVLSLYDFQIMCRESIDKFSSMLVENKPEPQISYHLGNNNSAEFLSTTPNQVVLKCELYDLAELDVVVDPLLAPTNLQLAEMELQVQAGCTDLQATNENQQTDDGVTKKMMANKDKSHEKGSQDEVHCDDDKLENSSDEEEFNTDSDCASPDSKAKTSLRLPFQCDTCSKKFRIQHCFEAHMRRHQRQHVYPCTSQNCERTFNRLRHLEQHLNDHDGMVKSGLRAHKRKNQSGMPIKPKMHMCETCGTVLTTSGALKAHRFIHIDKSEWPFVCDVEGCSKRFRILNRLKVHQKRHAGIKNHACSHCEMRFVSRSDLKNHLNHHTREKTWSCDSCPKICNTRANLQAHIKNNHEDRADVDPDNEIKRIRRFQCSFCDNAFLTADGKRYHEMIHTGEKPHVCEKCGKKFRQPAGLKTHMQTHIKDAPRGYVCRICGRAFSRSQTLKHHMTKHTGERPYKCDKCDLTFRWPNNLTRHQRLHGDRARPFQCSFCDNTFLTNIARKYHERIHTGEKPHVCDECGKKFRKSTHLKTHMRTHIKDAPRGYVCRICGSAFFTSQNLKHHEMKHTGEKPYKCDECNRTFTRSGNLKVHQRLHQRDKQVKETTESDKQANSKDISKDE